MKVSRPIDNHREIPHASSPTHSNGTVPVASSGPQRGSLSKVGHVAVVPSQKEESRNKPYFPSLKTRQHNISTCSSSFKYKNSPSAKRYVIRLAQRNVIIFARPFERPHLGGVLFLLPQERLSTAIVIPTRAGIRALPNAITHPDSKCLILCVPHNKQTATHCAMRTDE